VEKRNAKALKTVLTLISVVMLLAAWLGFGRQGLIHLYRSDKERQACVVRILAVAQENQALMDEIDRLTNDMEYLAGVARKELNVLKDNEVIYRFHLGTGAKKAAKGAGPPGEGEPGMDPSVGEEAHGERR
jgi:cell division protein FtsB